MTLKGKLIGFSCITSKKGTDCIFGWVTQEFDAGDKTSVGCRATQIQAFGDDCYSLKKQIQDNKLINKNVSCLGNWSNNSFSCLQIEEVK